MLQNLQETQGIVCNTKNLSPKDQEILESTRIARILTQNRIQIMILDSSQKALAPSIKKPFALEQTHHFL